MAFLTYFCTLSYGGNSSFDPYEITPIYGVNCIAKNKIQAENILTNSAMTDVAYYAKQKCGWPKGNVDKAVKFELYMHVQVMNCFGNSNASKIEDLFRIVAQKLTNNCDSENMKTYFNEYYKKMSEI